MTEPDVRRMAGQKKDNANKGIIVAYFTTPFKGRDIGALQNKIQGLHILEDKLVRGEAKQCLIGATSLNEDSL